MSTARFRFTPSMQDGETLEELFVAREGLLDTAMIAIRDAGEGEHRAHKLFVGPRGAGKTHLVALIHHRLNTLRADGLRVQASWLVEDPWDIGSYDELLDAILEARTEPAVARLGGEDPEGEILASVATGGPIVVLAENFDRILTAIGSDGQRKLRALLENSRPLLLMATMTRLSDEVARQDEPFYGFFEVTHLEPFGVEDAAAMLIALAKHEKNQAQLDLLERPEAARRLATIAHLAGGQPRVWALLGPALQTSGVEDLVRGLLARVDDLTPYYQEQLAHLSPQEARVVRRMAAHDRPLTVRGIAELAGVDQRSVGKTISDLRRRGWIKQYSSAITDLADKRHSYYVLAEPLARLAFQVKESRGEPIQLVVEFIAAWHDLDSLSGTNSSVIERYLAAARGSASEIAPIVHTLELIGSPEIGKSAPNSPRTATKLLETVDDALLELADRDPRAVLKLPAPLIALLDHAITTTHSVNVVRLELARLATDWSIDWRRRLSNSQTTGDNWLPVLQIQQEAKFGSPMSVVLIADQLAIERGSQDLLALSARVVAAGLEHARGDMAAARRMLRILADQQGYEAYEEDLEYSELALRMIECIVGLRR